MPVMLVTNVHPGVIKANRPWGVTYVHNINVPLKAVSIQPKEGVQFCAILGNTPSYGIIYMLTTKTEQHLHIKK